MPRGWYRKRTRRPDDWLEWKCRRGRSFLVKDKLGNVDLPAMVLVDGHEPSCTPVATVCALKPIECLADVDPISVLDRFAPCELQRFGKMVRLIGEPLGRHPVGIGGRPEREQYAQNHQRRQQFDQRKPAICAADVPDTIIRFMHMLGPQGAGGTSTYGLSLWAD